MEGGTYRMKGALLDGSLEVGGGGWKREGDGERGRVGEEEDESLVEGEEEEGEGTRNI